MPPIPTRRPARGALLAVLATVCAAGLPASAGAASLAVTAGSRYLALGDSVTFGYQESGVVPAPNYARASSFVNYPQQLGAVLGLKVTNPACPGETSASFIDPSAQSEGCENLVGPGGTLAPGGYRTRYPLHVRYAGSQLAFAVAFLRAHPNVRLVSLMIGANDYFVCQQTTSSGCTSQADLSALLSRIRANVRRILSAIRGRAHYRGPLAIVNYYSLDYDSAAISGLLRTLNRTLNRTARPYGRVVADGYGTFAAAAAHSGNDSCEAGLLTQLGRPGTCGIHPSYAGQTLLAQALGTAIRPLAPPRLAG
jgi:lysophospholipase L1-like esterase